MTHFERLRAEAKAQFLGNTQHTVTPSDEDTFPPSAVMNLDPGTNIEVVDQDGNAKVYPAAPAYWVVPVLVVKVTASGTTSTDIVRYQ